MFLFTTLLALVSRISVALISFGSSGLNQKLIRILIDTQAGWLIAFVSQAVATAQREFLLNPNVLHPDKLFRPVGHSSVGVLWFSIFLQIVLIFGVLHTLASDTVSLHRLQISVFTAIALVFAVIGVNQGLFSGNGALVAMAVGWLVLAVVNIFWVLYFTSEEDSLAFYILNSFGTGGLTPPNRRRRQTRTQSVTMGAENYSSGYAIGHGTGPSDMVYDMKIAGTSGLRSLGSLPGASGSVGGGPARNPETGIGTGGLNGASNVLDNSTAGSHVANGKTEIGDAVGVLALEDGNASTDGYTYKARALYTCEAIWHYDLCRVLMYVIKIRRRQRIPMNCHS